MLEHWVERRKWNYSSKLIQLYSKYKILTYIFNKICFYFYFRRLDRMDKIMMKEQRLISKKEKLSKKQKKNKKESSDSSD